MIGMRWLRRLLPAKYRKRFRREPTVLGVCMCEHCQHARRSQRKPR